MCGIGMVDEKKGPTRHGTESLSESTVAGILSEHQINMRSPGRCAALLHELQAENRKLKKE